MLGGSGGGEAHYHCHCECDRVDGGEWHLIIRRPPSLISGTTVASTHHLIGLSPPHLLIRRLPPTRGRGDALLRLHCPLLSFAVPCSDTHCTPMADDPLADYNSEEDEDYVPGLPSLHHQLNHAPVQQSYSTSRYLPLTASLTFHPLVPALCCVVRRLLQGRRGRVRRWG